MLGRGSMVATLAVTSAVLTSLLPNVSDAFGPSRSSLGTQVSSKGDRLTKLPPADIRPVASVEVSGAQSGPDIVMRDRGGAVVFMTSQDRGVARVAKNVQIAPPARPQEPHLHERSRAHNKVPVGCERVLSALVRSAWASQISKCVT